MTDGPAFHAFLVGVGVVVGVPLFLSVLVLWEVVARWMKRRRQPRLVSVQFKQESHERH